MAFEHLDFRAHGRKKIEQAGARWIETNAVNHQICFFDQQRRDQEEACRRQVTGNHQFASSKARSRMKVNDPFHRFDVRAELLECDLSEIALKEFGADIETMKRVIHLHAGARLTGRELVVPGDLSSACFFLVAALLVKEANLVIHGVGLNPTRSGLLDFLASMGAKIKVLEGHQVGGELIGDLRVETSAVTGGVVEGEDLRSTP